MEFKDYYKVLGVEKNASPDEIRKAYRKLVRKYHPDVSKEPDAAERMIEVNEANEVLGNEEKRQAYNTLYERVQNGGAHWGDGSGNFQPPPGWDEGFTFHRGAGSGTAHEAGFSDFFSSIFGSARGHARGFGSDFSSPQTNRPTKGQDQHASIEIPLSDAYKGAQRDITIRTLETDASGTTQWKPKTLRVKIPAGVHPGQTIRLSGQGLPGTNGATNGDLYIEVQIAPDQLYTVKDKDVYLKLPVTPTEAALGAQITIPLPDGQKIQVKIPEGTRNESKLRIKDRGIPGSPAGHLHLVIEIVLPPATTDAAKQAYLDLAKAVSFNPRPQM